jgi:DNA polymerase III delta prime subunit
MEFRVGEHFLFTEKYRPRKVEDCILPDRILNVLSKVVEDRKIPNMLFEGPPGTGKTTAARAICETIGIDYMIINGSEERGIDVLRNKIMDFAGTISLSGTGKCIIIDEADGLTPEAQAAFRGVIEKFADHCTFILTCNYTQKLIDAIVSRMATVSFYFTKGETDLLQIEMFKRVKAILKNENVSFDEKAIIRLIKKYFPDFRKTLGELQRFSANGTFDAAVIEQIGSAASIDKLLDAIREKDFKKARQWIADNHDLNSTMLYRKIYDGLTDHFDPTSIPQVILIIAKYQYQHSMVADPEINIAAFVIELMLEAKFKENR